MLQDQWIPLDWEVKKPHILLGRPQAGWAGAAARAAPRIPGRGAVLATVATFPRRRRRGAGTGPGSEPPPWLLGTEHRQ